MDIIPSINCADEACAAERLRAVRGAARWAHLDIGDGVFTFSKTWNDPCAWARLGGRLKLEVHLMVQNPEVQALDWLSHGAKRVIVHLEKMPPSAALRLKSEARLCGAEVMISQNPETPAERLRPYLAHFSEFQILAVHPGPSGQKLLPLALKKAEFVRREAPHAIIEIDGGVSPETAPQVRRAGADLAVAGSSLFGGGRNVREAYEELRKVLN